VDEPAQETALPQAESDWLLAALVNGVNKTGGGLGLTLWVGGTIVSGTVASIADYFEGLAADFASAKGEGAPSMRTLFEKLGAQSREAFEEARSKKDDDDDDVLHVRYIHLSGAHTFSPGGDAIPTGNGVWWRGRLDAIDGWCFGELQRA
jgi:hypothetical protein